MIAAWLGPSTEDIDDSDGREENGGEIFLLVVPESSDPRRTLGAIDTIVSGSKMG